MTYQKILVNLALVVACALLVCACGRIGNPGHDPAGPGNSENAPGHNKHHKR